MAGMTFEEVRTIEARLRAQLRPGEGLILWPDWEAPPEMLMVNYTRKVMGRIAMLTSGVSIQAVRDPGSDRWLVPMLRDSFRYSVRRLPGYTASFHRRRRRRMAGK
jgi:hypothetical protein